MAEDHFSPVETAAWQGRLGVQRAIAVARLPLARVAPRLDPTSSSARLSDLLSPPELARLQTLTFAKRRQEWLAGRLATKHAAGQVLALTHAAPKPAWPDMVVSNRPSGRPELVLLTGQPCLLPEISISHSHGWAMAMAVMGAPCGIDLQMVSTKTVTVQDRFCLARERDEICRLTGALALPERGLTLLWAAKEAVRKAVVQEVVPGFLEMELVTASCAAAGQWVLGLSLGSSGVEYAVGATFWGDFALAFTVVDEIGKGA